jgi:3-oxoacyl-(acyl-carrier-protein) synthase
LQIAEGTAKEVLAGGIDEMTLNHLAITRRPGHWKNEPVKNLEMLKWNSPGSLAGEGAGFFLLSAGKTEKTYAIIRDVKTIYKPASLNEITQRVNSMLSASGLNVPDIDLVLLGINGDNRNDHIYYDFAQSLFPGIPLAYYKHLCGEYHTSSAFALWLAANILKRQTVPYILRLNNVHREPVRNILVYNQYYNVNHSFILVSE